MAGIRQWMGLVSEAAAVTGDAPAGGSNSELAELLRAEQDMNLLLQESLADAEAALAEPGWIALGARGENFSREGLRTAAQLCRVMAVTNTLIKRGVALRVAYVWGAGVQVSASAGDEDGQQDVNAVIQQFLDDEGNRAAFSGEQAREENERSLATDGNLGLAFFTKPLSGRVQVRTIGFDELVDVVCNPEDKDEPWFYLRRWTADVVTRNPVSGTTTSHEQREAYYPALGYRPPTRPGSVNGIPVVWDTPVLLVSVNRLNDWKFGIGDVYTALPWARAYREFMADWAQLCKALSEFAWRLSTKGKSAASRAASRLSANAARTGAQFGADSAAGATLVGAEAYSLEAIPKTGATIDSESGRPLATLVAAGLDLPVTMLLGDPGVTGARATAETLDDPLALSMGARRQRWAEVYRKVCTYVVAESVRAPQGALKGTLSRDEFGREVLALAGDQQVGLEVTFPPLDKVDPAQRVLAIKTADDTGKLPPPLVARQLMLALEVPDVDEEMEKLVDANGNWIDPTRDQQLADAETAAQRALAAVGAGGLPPEPAPAAAPPAAPATPAPPA